MANDDTKKFGRVPRTLPIWGQISIITGFAAMAAFIVAFALGMDALFGTAQPMPPTAPIAVGVFRPSAEQLAGLIIKPVELETFRAETLADGFIAVDDDLSTPVFSPFSGRVIKVIATLGDRVAKGAPLLTVQASEFVQAQSDLTTALAQFNIAQTNEQRQRALYQAEGAALKDWQQSQVDLATAQAALTAVRNRLRILGKTDQEITLLETAPDARSTDAEAIIQAPIGGTIVQRQVGVGQYIQTGSSNALFSVGNLSTVWLVANVREADSSLVHIGDAVEVRVLAFPDKLFKATISYMAPSIDPATHRLSVRAEIDNRDGALKPQMFASFRILAGPDIKAPAIPQSAIVYDGDKARAWVMTPGGGLALRQIEVGRTKDGIAEIVKGLQVGEKIVTRGALFIDRAATDG